MSTATAEARDAATAATQAGEEPLSSTQKMAVARAARAFSKYGESRKVMATIAKAIVNLRLTFEKEGRPDFRGETPQYRGAIASLYEAAIPEAEERDSFKVAIRYWVAKEFAARVEAGSLEREALVEAGLMRAPVLDAPAQPQEPRRAATAADKAKTGVVVDGAELTPPEVLVEAERIVSEYATSDALGPIIALQSIARELGPVVAALRDEPTRDKLPGRSLKQSIESLFNLVLDAADLAGIDVDEHLAAWSVAHTNEMEPAAV